ncbi:MAG: AAA family ATPase [Chloroflexota bacterium]
MFPPDNQPFREPYKSSLFVGRLNALNEVEQWAKAATPQKRLFNIKAPPGYGKTWLLKEAERRLAQPGLFPLEANASDLTTPETIAKWLEAKIALAKKNCAEVRGFDATVALSQMIRALAEDLCERCYPAYTPIVIVDALDDALEAQARQLEKLLLEPFWSNNCVRILVAMRDDHRLYSAVLRGGERLFPLTTLSEEDATLQLQQRASDAELKTPVPDDLLGIIPPYDWRTPGINSFLSRCAAANREASQPLLSADDLRACRRAVIGPQLDNYHDGYLVKLSQLDDTWTEDTFAQQCNLTVSEAGDIAQKFFTLGIVTRPDRVPNRRKIVDGLRELMQAEHKLRSQ